MQSHKIISCPNQLHIVMVYHKHFHMDRNATIYFDAQNILPSTRGLSNLTRTVFQIQLHGNTLKSNWPILHTYQF